MSDAAPTPDCEGCLSHPLTSVRRDGSLARMPRWFARLTEPTSFRVVTVWVRGFGRYDASFPVTIGTTPR